MKPKLKSKILESITAFGMIICIFFLIVMNGEFFSVLVCFIALGWLNLSSEFGAKVYLIGIVQMLFNIVCLLIYGVLLEIVIIIICFTNFLLTGWVRILISRLIHLIDPLEPKKAFSYKSWYKTLLRVQGIVTIVFGSILLISFVFNAILLVLTMLCLVLELFMSFVRLAFSIKVIKPPSVPLSSLSF